MSTDELERPWPPELIQAGGQVESEWFFNEVMLQQCGWSEIPMSTRINSLRSVYYLQYDPLRARTRRIEVTLTTSPTEVERNIFMISQGEAPEEPEEEGDVRTTLAVWTVFGIGLLQIMQWSWQLTCAAATRCGQWRPRQQEQAQLPEVAADSGESTTRQTRRSTRQRAVTPFRVGRQTPYVCKCGYRLEAREVTSETSQHFTRLYVSCQRSRADPQRCDFFRWL